MPHFEKVYLFYFSDSFKQHDIDRHDINIKLFLRKLFANRNLLIR